MLPHLRYVATAAALGIAWYLVLLIPIGTREQLLPSGELTAADLSPRSFAAQRLLAMVTTSVLVAVAFRRSIAHSRWLIAHVAVSLILPLVGTIFFGWILTLLRGVPRERVAEAIFVSAFAVVPVVRNAYYVVFPMGLVSQLVMHRVGAGMPGENRRHLTGIVLAVAAASAPLSMWAVHSSGSRSVTHEMTWRYEEPSEEFRGAKHIRLTFVSYPDYSIEIYSDDLGAQLESYGGERVPVTFECMYNMGTMRSFRTARIGRASAWNSRLETYTRQGQGGRSPWDE